MPLTDQLPPLTVVVAAVVELLAASVITTEMKSVVPPVPLTVMLPTLAMLMFDVVVKATAGGTVSLVSLWVMVVVLPAASVSLAE